MFINPNFCFDLEIKNSGRLNLLKKYLNNSLKLGDRVKVPWYFMKSSSFRRHKMELKCDDCGKEFRSRIENLDPSNNIHYCNSCFQKGIRHYNFGGTISKSAKDSLLEWHKNNENPSKRKEVREKISISRMGKPSNMLGKHQSEKTKQKISRSNKIAIKEAWENGKLNYNSKYSNCKIKEYKGIKYQGKYELDFLIECDDLNILHLIDRGPALDYIDEKGKSRIYLVDYKIKNTDILIEIKSSYTLGINKKNNLCKIKSGKDNGDFILIINKDYSEFHKKINEYGF